MLENELIKVNRKHTVLFFCFYFLLITLMAGVIGYIIGYLNTIFFFFGFNPTKLTDGFLAYEHFLQGAMYGPVLAVAVFLVFFWFSRKIITGITNANLAQVTREPYLVGKVESLSAAVGITPPQTYIIESNVPNAFAIGRNPQDASVAVTRGLINQLNREELEGVLAHEIAHINNRDTLIATFGAALSGTIAGITRFIGVLLWGNEPQPRPGCLAMMFILVVGWLFLLPLFSRLLNFALKREREYLADASAVEIAGSPDGLINALIKINKYQHPKSNLAQKGLDSLFIVSPRNKQSAFQTHPPLARRIERLRKLS